jgi:hypothetical protein
VRITAGGSIVQSNTPSNSLVFDADHTSFTGRQAAFPGRFTIGPIINGYPEIGYNFYTSNAVYTKIANDTAWGIGFGVSNRMDFKYAGAGTGTFSWGSPLMSITSGGEILAGSTSVGVGFVNTSKIGSYQGYTSDSNSTAISAIRTGGFFGVDGGTNSNNQASYTAITANVQWGAANNPGAIFRGYQNTNLAVQISFSGNIANTNGSYGTISSDVRLKENIISATPKLEDLLKLNVVNFNLIGKEEKHIGFIAQEMQEVFPSFVHKNDTREYDEDGNVISGLEDALGIKVGMEFAILVKAIQELKSENDNLKSRLEVLEQS